jgi:AraC-like DNA-binding protein
MEDQQKNYSAFVRSQDSFFDLRVYQLGQEKCFPLHLYGPVKRNHYLFHYVLHGTGILQYTDSNDDDQTINIRQDEGFLIFPDQITTYFADKDNPWEYVWIEFDGIQAKKFISQVSLSKDNPKYSLKSSANAQRLRALLSSFISDAGRSDYKLLADLYLILDELIGQSALQTTQPHRTLIDEYISKVEEFIELNYPFNISVDDIAAHCGLNKSYLSRIFKRETSKPLHTFLLDYRLSRAAEMLEEGNLPIKTIAREVGYNDPFTFSRIFRTKYGISPAQWREKVSLPDSTNQQR